jgi:hypothetical protein
MKDGQQFDVVGEVSQAVTMACITSVAIAVGSAVVAGLFGLSSVGYIVAILCFSRGNQERARRVRRWASITGCGGAMLSLCYVGSVLVRLLQR